GKKSACSLPSRSQMRRSRRRTVGSPSRTSSPTTAFTIAVRISGVGRVTVTLRRSATIATANEDMDGNLSSFAATSTRLEYATRVASGRGTPLATRVDQRRIRDQPRTDASPAVTQLLFGGSTSTFGTSISTVSVRTSTLGVFTVLVSVDTSTSGVST